MMTGAFTGFHLDKFVPCVLYLLLPLHLCLAAPGLPGTDRDETVDAHPPIKTLPNPFGPGEGDRRLLQNYIQSTLKDSQGGPEISSWEQEVFFLFGVYDYDRSGLLDGLEMMKLLSDYGSHHAPGAQANELVVLLVDSLLQAHDLNQDGLLAPSELLSPSLLHTQPNNRPDQEQGVVVMEEKLSNPSTDDEKAGAAEQRREAHEEIQPHEVKTEEHVNERDEENEQQLAEVPAADQGHHQEAPVHQGQPEI
ncbi:cell growth regulator with EF hand domain protein 1 isoform X2 [Echeneis naucrates]|uniref:cell growth regulator with EF hand domain protein 1 isoform X2 n=1 Tax=Echeneis naucrates TaxID=173247 RepID=UPI001113AF39|nr:cell growth regulator with EF hand domain protein 1 isoform X2 [Echeneis naucrates]